ncbi:MAG: RNA polymerase sigma factor RpoD/SigA [Gemmatimonadales bacterium]|nr:RNA polymerase sigma factor RpoD/SigA [Gemmatimonadales bacterium]
MAHPAAMVFDNRPGSGFGFHMAKTATSRRMFFDTHALDSFDQYLQDVERYPLIENPQIEREIARKARAGDRHAAERLVTANLRFVISYVKKYQGRGLNLAELVCIGNEGLLKAVKKFDPDKGVKFISYAVWWIRQTVLQALAEQTRSVRIPLNQNSNLVKLSRTETALTQKLGRSPTDREIAEEMEEPVETVRALRRVASAELSLDAPLDKSDRDSASFGERFSGMDDADIEEDVEDQARREFLEKMFERYLTERERKILVLYYGLDDGEEMTLEEIGSLLGVTRERIRQIRNRAFDKLRASPDGEALEGFWRATA